MSETCRKNKLEENKKISQRPPPPPISAVPVLMTINNVTIMSIVALLYHAQYIFGQEPCHNVTGHKSQTFAHALRNSSCI